MKTPITSIKRLALALCLATPVVSWAATTKGYEDFGDTAGVVLWRGIEANFHESTVINVAADGALGDPYAMVADANNNTTSWQRFCRSMPNAYASPGKVLVYDTPGTDQGYKYNPNCTFGPLSFGGMWVKTLAINGLPFSILGSGDRKTEFGASGKSTLFKFDASYTIDRTGTTTFYGDATVDIAQGATFTAQANSSHVVAVDSAATLKLKGAGTLVVTTMNVAGTLDLSATTVPTISGNVAFAGDATLVLPSGINPTTELPLTVCSGALSAAGVVYVKVGDAEPVEAELTISGGAITGIDTGIQTEQTFTSDYPSVVPAGYTYTYEATEAVTIPAVTVNGTLKTSGPITITDLDIANGADFEVVAGNTTVGCSADCKLKGNITVDAGATLTNTRTDSLSYNHSMTVDVYGTLAMGTTRWSIPGGCTFKLQNGAQVTGTGDGWASLDFINGASRGLDVYGSATIEGKMRVRANETRIWVNEGSTLVLSSGIADGGGHHAGFKQVGLGTLEIHANSTGLSGNDSVMTQGTLRLVDTTLAFPVALQGNSSYLEVVATEAATTVPVNVTSIANNNVTFSGAGKVNGSITKTSAPGGNLATALQSSAWTGTFVADWAGAHDTRFDINSYGNANSVVEVTKLAGGYVSGSNANVTVVPTVKVSGFMKLANGYSGKVTTLTKLTGNGVFTNETYSVDITTLDNFTGTLVPLIASQYIGMKIGTINLSSTPSYGDKIVKLGESSNIGQIGKTKVSVNGVVDEMFAVEKRDDGLYAVAPGVAYTITVDWDYSDPLNPYPTYTKVFYATLDGAVASGADKIYLLDTTLDAPEGWEKDGDGNLVPLPKVAYVDGMTADYAYTDFSAALSAALAEGTHTLYVVSAQTMDALTVPNGCSLTLSVPSALGGALTVPAIVVENGATLAMGTAVTSAYSVAGSLTLNTGDFSASTITLTADAATCTVKNGVTAPAIAVSTSLAEAFKEVVTAPGDNNSVIYSVAAMPVIRVPSVEHATATATIGGETVALDANGQAAVPAGSVVMVTYTADEGYTFGNGQTEYTINTASATTFVLDESTVAAQYVASITTGELVVKYTSLQAAIDAVTQNNTDIVLLANDAEGATVSRAVTFHVVPGEYTYGDIIAGGDFILTVTTPAQGKTRYSVAAALIAVTINDVRTLYPATMEGYNAAIEAANAGPIGTTLEVLSGDPAAYVEYLPMFDLENGVFTKVTVPVAAVYQGVIQQQVYRTLVAAVNAATAGQTVKLLAGADGAVGVNANDITLDLAGFTVTGGDAIKWTGSGKLTIVDSVGGGKAIATAADGCAIWVTGGTVEVQAGYFQNSSEEEATVYVGVAGASAIITGGTFKNTVQDYKWAGSDFDYYCLNVGNALPATSIQVSGGSFSHDPAKGDDKLGSLLAEGYASTWNPSTGYYDVAEVQEVPVKPGDQTDPVDTYAEAEAEAAKVVPSVPTAVAAALTDEQEVAYKALFEAKVVNAPGDKYAVAIELKDTVVAELEDAVADAVEDEDLDLGALATADADTVVAITAKPGLYYGVKAGSAIGSLAVKSCVMATDTTISVTFPKGAGADAKFYQVFASPTPLAVQE